jgi:hypothetical protein
MTTGAALQVSGARRLRRLVHSDAGAFVAAGAVALAVALGGLREPPRISSVSITNATDFDIAVEVRGPSGGWMPLATAGRSETTSVADVIDQGDTWTFRFSAQGVHPGSLQVERRRLAASGWVIEIPPEVEQDLLRAGAPLPP